MPESKKSSLRARTDNTDQEQSGISPVTKAFLQNIVQRYCLGKMKDLSKFTVLQTNAKMWQFVNAKRGIFLRHLQLSLF